MRIDRRHFIARSATLAAGSLIARAGTSQPVRRRPQRVAVIGVGHYHAFSPPNYLAILQSQKTDIVGVHDPDAAIAAKYAAQVGSTPFTDYRSLVETQKPEFVIALGHHAAMPATFRYLVEAGVPFLMEKPWGVDDRTVRQLADLAESKHAWVAVPMPFRYSWWAETAKRMRERGELGAISHVLFRFNQPGVQRYIDSGSSWILTKAEAGGGALLNLGIHGFDVMRYITGEEPKVVAAVTSHATQRREVEDYAHVTLRTPGGVICLNEASYTYPTNGSDQERKVAAEKAVLTAVTAGGEGVRIVAPGRSASNDVVRAPESYLAGWPGAVNDCLDRIGRGEPPAVTARDCARAVSLVFDAYRAAGEIK
jgi:predicted dehydrogenase